MSSAKPRVDARPRLPTGSAVPEGQLDFKDDNLSVGAQFGYATYAVEAAGSEVENQPTKGKRAMMRRFHLFALAAVMLLAGLARAQQYPLMDMVADKVIQKYQQSSCEQLWQRKGQSQPQKEKEMLQMLRDDPQMRAAFINKVAAPIANKMFECGLIP